jgi:hypothetical protein
VIHEGQEILVAIGLQGRGVILGYRGAGVFVACSEGDPYSIDPTEDVFPLIGYPGCPGVYVWHGTIECGSTPEGELDVGMEGGFREASAVDVWSLLGRHDPPMPKPEEDRD